MTQQLEIICTEQYRDIVICCVGRNGTQRTGNTFHLPRPIVTGIYLYYSSANDSLEKLIFKY